MLITSLHDTNMTQIIMICLHGNKELAYFTYCGIMPDDYLETLVAGHH